MAMKRLVRFSLVFAAVWGALALLGRMIRLSVDWPLWVTALAIAGSVELILWLYAYEAGAVDAKRARWLIGLRLSALAMLVWILIAPVWVRTVSRERSREVVVVMDDSGSMHLKDDRSSATRLELGEQALSNAKLVGQLGEKTPRAGGEGRPQRAC